jgi:hypothetical protein
MDRMLRATDGEQPFAATRRYITDPAFAAAMDAQREIEQRRLNAQIDASIARVRAERGQG